MARDRLAAALRAGVDKLKTEGLLDSDVEVEILLETPPNSAFGDFATNLGMILARHLRRSPREAAQLLLDKLDLPADLVKDAKVAGAGFINFTLAPSWLHDVVRDIHLLDARFGHSDEGRGRKLQVEFVSANPTGPLTVVQGRAAAIGDTLANLFTARGWQVSREYYINDAASSLQVRRFGQSLEARYCQLLGHDKPLPEDGYRGDYLLDIARRAVEEHGDSYLKEKSEEQRIAEFTSRALEAIIENQRLTMQRFGVAFDVWFRESSLYESAEVEAAINALKQRGYTYEKDGALWLRTTQFGDDKDRVLVRRDGRPTYLAADAAYHNNKFSRGLDRVIDIWGPDHHGYVQRTTAAVQALGYDGQRLQILLHGLIRLFRGSDEVRMSKRGGDIITLDEVIDEVGPDAARFFFLMRAPSSPLDFDLELAKRQSDENPVYYVQYAHARICSIMRMAQERGVPVASIRDRDVDLSLLDTDDDRALMRKLADFPEEIELAADQYEPHRLTRYAQELASTFHVFYTNCRVLGDDPSLTASRLALVQAARIVLRNTLGLMGVSAPDRM